MQLTNVKNQTPELKLDLIPPIKALIDSYPVMENVGDVVISVDDQAKRDIDSLERGQVVEVKVRDQHLGLLMAVQVYYEDHASMYPPEIKALFGKYFVDHQRFMEKEQEMMMMANPEQAMASTPSQMSAQLSNDSGNVEGTQDKKLGSLIGR